MSPPSVSPPLHESALFFDFTGMMREYDRVVALTSGESFGTSGTYFVYQGC